METGVGEMDNEMDNGMDAEAKVAEGLRLIEESSLTKKTKGWYRPVWEDWGRWCADAGVDPLGASWEDVLEYLPSVGSVIYRVRRFMATVTLVYHARGEVSPMHDRRLDAAFGRHQQARVESNVDFKRRRLLAFRLDYLAWCRLGGMEPAPASVEQVVKFLSTSCEHLSYEVLRLANCAVSLYLTEQGHPPTERHPLVQAALKELVEKRLAREAASGGGKQLSEFDAGLKGQWESWRDTQGIVAGAATGPEVVEHLRRHEHDRGAGRRVIVLRNACEGETAFWSEEVQGWLDEFKARRKRGDVPGHAAVFVRKIAPVLAEWTAARAARAGADLWVPVGLTREEVERVRVGEGRQLETTTVEGYAYAWAKFSEWRKSRGILSLKSVEPVHIRVYLEEAAGRLTAVTLWHIVDGLVFGFEEHGFLNNPATGEEVLNYMRDLVAERKEAPLHMDPIREKEFNAILKSAFKPRPRERAAGTELRGAVTVSLVRLMFDGLLRGSEASRARWGDLSRSADGSGSLLLPRSKTDKFGRGEYTYVSAVAFQYLDLLRDLRRFNGKAEREDDRIFGMGIKRMDVLIKKACADAGLVGRFGTHSMRIGGAQELAIAGFSLPMIMLAGRWATPDSVKLYIEGIKVLDSAMAQLQRILATGKHRLGPDARGIDVMSNYALVRLVR